MDILHLHLKLYSVCDGVSPYLDERENPIITTCLLNLFACLCKILNASKLSLLLGYLLRGYLPPFYKL